MFRAVESRNGKGGQSRRSRSIWRQGVRTKSFWRENERIIAAGPSEHGGGGNRCLSGAGQVGRRLGTR